ncbi:MAG: hypothetical protein V8S96_03120 [Lachnospiraceae bacterium]
MENDPTELDPLTAKRQQAAKERREAEERSEEPGQHRDGSRSVKPGTGGSRAGARDCGRPKRKRNGGAGNTAKAGKAGKTVCEAAVAVIEAGRQRTAQRRRGTEGDCP